MRPRLEPCIARGLAFAPYSDLLWMETSTPDLARSRGRSPRRSRRSTRTRCSPTTARRRSTGGAPGRRHHRQVPEGARRDGVPVPVHHAGRVPRAERVDVRARLRVRARRHVRLRQAAGGRVRPRAASATPPPGTSARPAPGTSTWSPRRSRRTPRRWRWPGRPRRRSSRRSGRSLAAAVLRAWARERPRRLGLGCRAQANGFSVAP